MQFVNDDADPNDLRLKDISTFIAVYDLADGKLLEQQRTTLKGLFSSLEGVAPTTTVGRLKRIADFLFNKAPHLRKGKGSGFDLLFTSPSRGAGLVPTQAAQELYKHFRDVTEICLHSRDAALRKLTADKSSRPVVRIGAPNTVGLGILAHIFSNWEEGLFSEEMELKVEITSSTELVPRLHNGLLDCVIGYGTMNRRDIPNPRGMTAEQQKALCREILEPELDVCFRSLDLSLRMVLLCHPNGQVWTKAGKNPNLGYWATDYWPEQEQVAQRPKSVRNKKQRGSITRSSETRRPKPESPQYKDLRAIDLRDIDFGKTQLIVVSSWHQPDALQRLIDEIRQRVEVREASSYNEALALVRMGQGVAVALEFFRTEENTTAFRLTQQDDYERWLGVYYNTRHGLKPEPYRAVRLVEAYLNSFKLKILEGKPPTFGDGDYMDWCMTQQRSLAVCAPGVHSWGNESETAYPVFG